MKEGWNTVRMSEAFELQMGKTPSRDNSEYWNGDETWVSISDLGNSKFIANSKEGITTKAIEESGIKIVPQGCVLMSFKLSVGKVAITECPLYTNEAIMSFKPKDEFDLIPEYIYYYLKGYKWDGINRAAMGQTLNKATISQGLFSYPPLAEQEQIVAELDLLSGIIDKQKAQLKELDTLAQSIFYDMFGNPYFNNKQWDVQQLGDVCSFSQGIQVDVSEQITEPREGWNRFLRIVDYTSDNTDIRYVHINNQQYWIDKDDIAMVRYGSVGVVGINKTGILANNLFKINYHRHQFDKHFLFYFFNTDYFLDYISKVAFGATMPALSFKVMKSLKIFIPDISLQRLFAEKIVAIESQKETINRSIAESQKLFDYTMDKYFS